MKTQIFSFIVIIFVILIEYNEILDRLFFLLILSFLFLLKIKTVEVLDSNKLKLYEKRSEYIFQMLKLNFLQEQIVDLDLIREKIGLNLLYDELGIRKPNPPILNPEVELAQKNLDELDIKTSIVTSLGLFLPLFYLISLFFLNLGFFSSAIVVLLIIYLLVFTLKHNLVDYNFSNHLDKWMELRSEVVMGKQIYAHLTDSYKLIELNQFNPFDFEFRFSKSEFTDRYFHIMYFVLTYLPVIYRTKFIDFIYKINTETVILENKIKSVKNAYHKYFMALSTISAVVYSLLASFMLVITLKFDFFKLFTIRYFSYLNLPDTLILVALLLCYPLISNELIKFYTTKKKLFLISISLIVLINGLMSYFILSILFANIF
jgi:hypothetical protein